MFYGSLFHVDQSRLVQLSRSQILVYSAIISHGGKNRTFTGSQSKLAKIAGVSVGSVKRSLKHFEQQGWLASSEYYQVKKYTLNRPEIDQSLGPSLDHSLDLPSKDTVDHSLDLPLDHSLDLPLDQSLEPHVTKNNKEEQNSFHDMTPTTSEQKIFLSFFKRWQTLQGWKAELTIGDFERLLNKATNFDFVLEIKIIDSWLLKEYNSKSGRCWKQGWFDALIRWFDRQNEQGPRHQIKLSKVQRYFLDFAVTEDEQPTPPIFLVDEETAPKVSPSGQQTFQNALEAFQAIEDWSTHKEELFLGLLLEFENNRTILMNSLTDLEWDMVCDQLWDKWPNQICHLITAACGE